jgi:hypothetical protein
MCARTSAFEAAVGVVEADPAEVSAGFEQPETARASGRLNARTNRE